MESIIVSASHQNTSVKGLFDTVTVLHFDRKFRFGIDYDGENLT